MLREAKRLVEKREKQATLDAEEKLRIRAYVETLKAKKIRLDPALGGGERFPTVDPSTSAATYWTLFVYPESMQTDVVEAASEISTLGEHLDVLFNPPVRARVGQSRALHQGLRRGVLADERRGAVHVGTGRDKDVGRRGGVEARSGRRHAKRD